MAIIDADPLTRAGIRAMVATRRDVGAFVELDDLAGALRRLPVCRPSVVFVEAGLASEDAGAAIRAIRRSVPDAGVIAFGAGNREEELFHIFSAGAAGYVTRSAIQRDLFTAMRRVSCGELFMPPEVERLLAERRRRPRLTPREAHVLQFLATARSNATIACVLGISVGTVKLHVKSILSKLGAEDRTEAVVIALQRGFSRMK